ncbi:hypothetical protein [Agrobacterium tomkonis]|uniref:hypothetical protein n=1 Tax=Agrobacterium tomkonis TaxID=1183410 RepID=UPI001CD89863
MSATRIKPGAAMCRHSQLWYRVANAAAIIVTASTNSVTRSAGATIKAAAIRSSPPVTRRNHAGYWLVYPGLGVKAVRGTLPQNRGLAMGICTAFLDAVMAPLAAVFIASAERPFFIGH